MFGDLLRRLTVPDPTPLPDPDARLALAALLVRVAVSDGNFDDAEKARIDRILTERHGLTPEDAAALRAQAEILEAEAPDTVRFTRAIKDAVAYNDRISVIEALWSVALADGLRDDDEDTLLRLVAKLLGVRDVDNALARQRVEAKNQ